MHKTVLLKEVISYLSPKSPGVYVDATVGGGGHARMILEKSSPEGRLIGIDIDHSMLKIAESNLSKYKSRYKLVKNNYINIREVLSGLNINKVDGVLLDLGVSTEHFLNAERGFSLLKEGPLDMRLDDEISLTAEKIVNEWSRPELLNVLFEYGEEKKAKRIVNNIVNSRKRKRIKTTKELAEIVCKTITGRERKYSNRLVHPATKVFQALRISVNNELGNIKKILPIASDLLNKNGRIAVISFHSLEDRIVKKIFSSLSKKCLCAPEVPHCICGHVQKLRLITKKPIMAGKDELKSNSRARSAKLRVAERI